jgi:hypothetical protein
VPNLPGITHVVADRALPPILSFPDVIGKDEADVAIHFFCMGAEDAEAFVRSFEGRVGRLVLISSCDVYRAYGPLPEAPPRSTRTRASLH